MALDEDTVARRIATAPELYRSLIDNPAPRFAVVRGARSVRQVEAYLPSNYALMESFEVEHPGVYLGGGNPHTLDRPARTELVVIIGGYDSAGWTLGGYVIPRLASGLIGCEEVPA